jgi:hypothetical protein
VSLFSYAAKTSRFGLEGVGLGHIIPRLLNSGENYGKNTV